MTTGNELAISRERMLQEEIIANDMRDHVKAILAREDSTTKIKGGTHVNRVALLAMAGHLNIQCQLGKPEWIKDPTTGDPMVGVECIATRPDGIASNAYGYVSYSEMQGSKRRWPDTFAMISMAQTRSQVRALSALLQPIIQAAQVDGVSYTPAEDMPTGAHPMPNRALVTTRTDDEMASDLNLPDGDTYRDLMKQCLSAGRMSKDDQMGLLDDLGELGLTWDKTNKRLQRL